VILNLAMLTFAEIPSQPLAPVVEEWDIPIPDVSTLIIQDDTGMDNLQREKQMRLLTEPLYGSWQTERPFLAMANVGLFHETKQTPVVPDVMLSLDVSLPPDWTEHKKHLSYFIWERGKGPDVVIEIISDKRGGERSTKMDHYASIRIPFYAVFDTEHQIQDQDLSVFVLVGDGYEPMTVPVFFKKLGIGLTLWTGSFEGVETQWLRWADATGAVIPTGAERANAEKVRADAEKVRANAEKVRADEEKMRADAAEARAADLEAKLKALQG
jgi:Uma2 family endonuclease